MSARRPITNDTQLCCVIGNPIAHSLSPAIHNAGYEHLGLDFVYLAFRVEDVGSALAGMRALSHFRGMSVTIPHKVTAMQHVDEVEAVDRAIGAINTIVHEGDRLLGLGTDGPGALKALADAGVSADEHTVLILGTGGAARAIAFTLACRATPREIALMDIDETMLRTLANDVRHGSPAHVTAEMLTGATLEAAMARADIVIHCTPIGMHPREDASLVPAPLFRPGQVVFDIVYTPLETQLLADARSRGCTIIRGVDMFVNQAVLQFERFTGAGAPVEVMRRVVMEHLQK